MQERNLIEHIRKPLTLFLPIDVQSPNGVVERFRTHIHLCCQWLFRQVHECTTNLKILREVVFPVYTYHRLAFLLVSTLAFQRYVDSRTCINDALVKDSHLAGTVINAIVRTLIQGYTSRCYYHRSLWNIVGAKGNYIRCRSTILTNKDELILFGNLLCDSLCRVVELFEDILVCNGSRNSFIHQGFAKSVTERLGHREEYTSVADGIALHVVKIAIGVWIVIVVQSVSIQKFDERLTLYLWLGDI